MPTLQNGLYRNPGGKCWLYEFKFRGKKYKGSTGLNSQPAARLWLKAYREQLANAEVGICAPPEAPTLQSLVEEWTKANKGVLCDRHLATGQGAAKNLDVLLGEPMDALTTARVEEWRQGFLADHKPATANLVLRYLKAWCHWGIKRGILQRMSFDVKPLRWQQVPRPTLKAEHVKAFLAAVDARGNAQVRAAVRMLLGLGMREEEVRASRWEWLDMAEGTYSVGAAKSKRTRVIPVPSWVLQSLEALRPDDATGWIFPGEEGNPHPAGWLRKALARGAKALGFNRLGSHRMRASFATMHAESTSLPDLQAMLGHAAITTTRIYIEDDLERRRRAQDALGDRLGLGPRTVPTRKTPQP